MKHRITLLHSALLALWVFTSSAPALAQTDPLINGSLDSYDGSGLATGWVRWWEEVPNPNTGDLNWAAKPDWGGESNPALVMSGLSQHIGATWNPWHAGIYQTITVAPNTQIRVSASGRVFASNDNFPASDGSVPVAMQVGADPNGGAEWWSGSVQWSGAGSPHSGFQTFSIDVTSGASGKVTIFLSVNYRGQSRLHLDAWWDNASVQVLETLPTPTNTLVPVTAAPTSSVANPTATPMPPTPLPAATEATATPPASTAVPAAPTATSGPGMVCVTVFEDTNGNGFHDADEALIPDSGVTLNGQPGSTNPYCFENLAAGQYTLAASLPGGYFATTGDQQIVNLASAQRADVQFGAQSSRIAAPPATATPQPDSSASLVPAILGVGTVLLLLVGVVVAVIIVRTRR